ncbi:sugar transferase [Desulfogranum japonicum]|uniref:sugar transferase n=1 Tax=Desulfogranum japonicum TaxID=231447 RepID=UPI000492146A
MVKRIFDLFFSLLGLLILLPLFFCIGLWIKIDSPGPVFFRQDRVGRFGKIFRIFKFRTMVDRQDKVARQLTVGKDPRITDCGRFLRRTKLDELPQLLNVIRGEMSLVGPRPEVPRYVEFYPEDVRQVVLSLPPGITDYASIEFKNENSILGDAFDPEKTYIEQIIPLKLVYYQRYVADRTLFGDILLIMKTFKEIIKR